ncbi:outer membrane protein assembly factor BamB family protein [Pseudoroseicyclus sp. H15]
MKLRSLLVGSSAAILALAPALLQAEPVTPDRLLNAGSEEEAANWLMVHRTYDGNRFSPLDGITVDNVGNLELAYAMPIGGTEPAGFGVGSMETTPLVNDGFLYLSDPWGTPYKIDVSSGDKGEYAWICDTGIDKDPSRGILLANRGLALWGNLVISALNDGRVIACDDEYGDILWETQVTQNPGEGFTAAPLVIGDKILVGQSYGDWATRGYIAALDAETGEEVWRFYTVPEPGQPGSETWLCDETGNPDCWKTGGGAAWVTGSYDPESNLTIWGTGNPVPMYDPEFRPGSNLYTNSSVALNVDTGEMEWFFQYTPGDYMDYDEVGVQLLVDTQIDGEDRKVLAHFGRNGIFYTLDRTNGSYINSGQYVNELTWTEGIDPKTGKPVEYDPDASLQTYAMGSISRAGDEATTCPNIQGGVNFFPTAYNPNTGVAYGVGLEGCSDLSVNEVAVEDVTPGQIFTGGAGVASGEQNGSITAIDVATATEAAKVQTPYPMYSGVLVTPGLVWTGQTDGTFAAYDGESLDELWSINIGNSIQAPPITFEVDGTQYVAITGGGIGLAGFGYSELEMMPAANMLYVFKLGE